MAAPMQLDLIVPGENDVEIVDPDTGEQMALGDASNESVAAVLRVITERMRDLAEKKRWLGSFLIGRMDADALWTVRGVRVKVTAKSPQADTIEWDAVALDAILDELVSEGVITADAKTAAVSQRIELVKHAAGIKALEKLPAVAERIAAAKSTVPAGDRHVSVSVIA
jgi:hypothetical protein